MVENGDKKVKKQRNTKRMMEEKMKEGIKTKKYIRNDGREDERKNKKNTLGMIEEKMKEGI